MHEVLSPDSNSRKTGALKLDQFHSSTFITALVAAIVTLITAMAGIPTWAAFLGWVGYCISGQSTRESMANLASFLIGLTFGIGTGVLIGILTPHFGTSATPLAIFAVVVLVMSLRNLAPVNNPLAYFLGITSFFASNQAPSTSALASIGIAGVIGALSAWAVASIQSRLQQFA